MKRAWLVAGVLVVAAACSNERDAGEPSDRVALPDDLPLCTDLFQNGAPVDPETFGRACRNEADELEVPRYADLPCEDGATLLWNDRAWGYKTEPMTLFAPDDLVKMPRDEIQACLGTNFTTTIAP